VAFDAVDLEAVERLIDRFPVDCSDPNPIVRAQAARHAAGLST
jgi:hypothetical protein